VVADQIGGSTAGSAEHLGTSPGSLDTGSGLMSALGGMGVHAMSFEGSDILPTANPAGTSMWLEESNQYGQTPTNWVSHPSGIGYRRSSPGITTWSGSGSGSTSSTGAAIPGDPVTMDTGMSDGGNQDEINRLNNFITGGNENPTAMQQGPIGRAEQTAMPVTPTGGPTAVAFGETTGRDVIGDVMNQQGGGTWTPYGNPLYQSPSASPSGPSGSERSGASGRGYGNGGGYGGGSLASAPVSPPPNAEEQQPGNPDEGRPYQISATAKPTQADIDMVRNTLAEMLDNSPSFRKLFGALLDGSFEYKFNYIVSNIPYTKKVEQFSHGMAGFSDKTTAEDRARGLYSNIRIYVNHQEFKLLPPELRNRFVMDVLIHETIHSFLQYNKPRFVDDNPDPTGGGGPANTATLRDWMNQWYPLSKISDEATRAKLEEVRNGYGNLDIGEMSQQYILKVIAEVEEARKKKKP
jgi:hypothetical protein